MINANKKEKTMIKTKQKQDPLDAYILKCGHIESMLNRLTEACDDHFGDDPDKITWGHVGSLGAIEEKLQHLCDMVFKEGEYAPENKA
jgi:hypothetical protein